MFNALCCSVTVCALHVKFGFHASAIFTSSALADSLCSSPACVLSGLSALSIIWSPSRSYSLDRPALVHDCFLSVDSTSLSISHTSGARFCIFSAMSSIGKSSNWFADVWRAEKCYPCSFLVSSQIEFSYRAFIKLLAHFSVSFDLWWWTSSAMSISVVWLTRLSTATWLCSLGSWSRERTSCKMVTLWVSSDSSATSSWSSPSRVWDV